MSQHVALNAVGDVDKGSLLERDDRRAISVTFNTAASKVTLIGSNCPAYQVAVVKRCCVIQICVL